MSLKDRLAEQPAIGTAIAVQNRHRIDAADQLAAAISFFGFVSVFPLLTLALATAGYVLDDPDDQVELALTLTEAIPGFDALLADEEGAPGVAALLENVVARRGTIGAIGLVTLLVAGLKVVAAAMTATRVVFRGTVMTGVRARIRQLLTMVGLGVLALLAVGGSSLAGTGVGLLPPLVAFVLALAVTFALDFVLFLGAYTLLSPTSPLSVREMVPGALLAAIGWSLLKVVGATYVSNQVEGANALYGALGGVVGLLLLFYLAGRLYLYGAELSAVLAERLEAPLERPDDVQEVRVSDRDHSTPGRDAPARRTAVPTAQVRARDPGPEAVAPTIRDATRARLAAAEGACRTSDAARDRGDDARRTVAFALAAAALAAAWRFLRPSRR